MSETKPVIRIVQVGAVKARVVEFAYVDVRRGDAGEGGQSATVQVLVRPLRQSVDLAILKRARLVAGDVASGEEYEQLCLRAGVVGAEGLIDPVTLEPVTFKAAKDSVLNLELASTDVLDAIPRVVRSKIALVMRPEEATTDLETALEK
jgi:hypothetical protein